MKRTMSILAGGLLAASMILLLPVVHRSGTVDAAGPPTPAPTFWKVSMPDLGQHSDNWCWVAAAANSFWWYGVNVPGQEGLLGGGGLPWEAIDPASTNAGSVCWYDSRDRMPPNGDGAAPAGYATVLRMIAQTTFMDANQNGIQDAGESNYCYGDGVEKWDYLIGLRDYVKNYGSNLKVHDIIDPTQCAVGAGLKVNRGGGAANSRNPCGPGGSGVPGVDQVKAPPTFSNYQTELSGGQDVLLWMEPAPAPTPSLYPETAHVVTGVGYNQVGGAFGNGTITVSDPWTHTTNPSVPPPPPGVVSASHTDVLAAGPPWQPIPDHNTSPNHGTLPATEPYNLCDVTQVAPLSIRCYNEDTGAPLVWKVVDMIFVSPEPVGGIYEEAPAVDASSLDTTASGGSSGPNALATAGIAAGAIVLLAAGSWYARRRLLR